MRGKHAPLPPAKEALVAWERAERDTRMHASIKGAKAHVDMSLPATLAMPHLASNKKREALERGTCRMWVEWVGPTASDRVSAAPPVAAPRTQHAPAQSARTASPPRTASSWTS